MVCMSIFHPRDDAHIPHSLSPLFQSQVGPSLIRQVASQANATIKKVFFTQKYQIKQNSPRKEQFRCDRIVVSTFLHKILQSYSALFT